jgi:hypothetical protein
MSTKWSTKILTKNGSTDFGELLKDEYAVVLLQGKNVFGDMIYCYLKVALPDIDRLKIALQTDAQFTASDYGTVIAAGKGEPPEEVRNEIGAAYPMFEQPRPIRPPAAVVSGEKKAWDEY